MTKAMADAQALRILCLFASRRRVHRELTRMVDTGEAREDPPAFADLFGELNRVNDDLMRLRAHPWN